MLGAFLKSIRRGRGIKCKEMKDLLGVSEKNIHYIEKNPSAYSERKLAKHAAALNYRVEMHFIDLEDSRNVIVYEVKIGDNNT